MNPIIAEESSVIPASPEAVFNVIADYQVGHQAILPRPPFRELTVVKGGFGEGSELKVSAKINGKVYHYHQRVTIPEPGRVIEERDIETDQVTYFILDPVEHGTKTRVTIRSEFPRKTGLTGLIEKLFIPSVSRGIYRKELQLLRDYVRSNDYTKVSPAIG